MEFNVVNKLNDNKVLISETNKYAENQPVRYYIANQDNADKFIKSKKSLEMANKFQKSMSGALAVSAGVLAGVSMKHGGKVGKIATGIAVGVATLIGALKLDITVNNLSQKNNIKRMNVEEITDNEEKLNEALNYKNETTENVEE